MKVVYFFPPIFLCQILPPLRTALTRVVWVAGLATEADQVLLTLQFDAMESSGIVSCSNSLWCMVITSFLYEEGVLKIRVMILLGFNESLHLPFGLKCKAENFQRLKRCCVASYLYLSSYVYLCVGILVASMLADKHLEHLKQV